GRGRAHPRVRAGRAPAEDPRRHGLPHPPDLRPAALLMAGPLRVALGQLRSGLGDVEGNLARVRDGFRQAAAGGAALACFPELCLSGYLLARADYADALLDAV